MVKTVAAAGSYFPLIQPLTDDWVVPSERARSSCFMPRPFRASASSISMQRRFDPFGQR